MRANPLFVISATKRLSNKDTIAKFKELARAKSEAEITCLKNEILLGNIGLVINDAKRFFKYTGLDADDLLEEGLLGLRTAIDKFDVTRGYQFSTVAWQWIRQRRRRYLESQNMDRVRSKSMSLDSAIKDANSNAKTFVDMLQANTDTHTVLQQDDASLILKKVADKVLTKRERLVVNLMFNI